MGKLLYSTNPYYSVEIARRYRKGRFYAWCNEVFCAGQQAGDAPHSMIASSSDPMSIYSQLRHDVDGEDRHSALIRKYKRTFKGLAETWLQNNEITKDERDEIRASCGQTSYKMWRPFLFVVLREPLETSGRLSAVPAKKRASLGPEYIVTDMAADEFDLFELPQGRR